MTLRLVRWLGIGLAAAAVLTIAGAWLVPPLLDWNRYRAEIAELVSFNLGRAVTIEGPVSLSLLPEPILTAGRVSVADAQDGLSIATAELRVRLALGPLLSGRVDARELVLRGLDMRLPWPLGAGTLALRAPTWLSSISARIEGGTLSIGSLTATAIDATLGLVPDTGSYAIAGTTTISGQAWHLTARLTRTGTDGTAGLDLSLDGQGPVQGLGAMFSGQIAADGALSGRVSGSGPDLSRLLAAPAVPFKADGRLGIAGGLAVADELSVDIAGAPARGAVSLRLEPALRLDVSLAASRLDLDQWLPALLRGGGGKIVPAIPTGIDLSAEAATLAGGILRGLRGGFELDPTTVTLRDVQAVLPGDARLALVGRVRRSAPAGLQFDGTAQLAAANLRATLGWIEAAGVTPLSALPPGVLRTADLHAAVIAEIAAGAPPQIVLTDLQGLVDQSRVQGGLVLHLAPRLGVAGAVSLDHLALDPWITRDWAGLAGMPSRLGRLDLDLQLRADQASLRGQSFAPVALDAGLEAGRLTLRRLDAQSSGARVVVSGSLTDAGRITDGRLDLATAPDETATLLARLMPGLDSPGQHLPRGAFSLNLLATGPPEALALKATADLGDLHVEALPVVDLPGGRWAGAVSLRHPGAPRLLDSIGVGNTASWLGDGSLSFTGNVSGIGTVLAPTRIASDGFDLAAGSLRANGTLAFDRTGRPRLTGRVTAETLPLPLPYPRSPAPLPIARLVGVQAAVKIEAAQVLAGLSPILQQARATLSLDDGMLRLDGMAAKLDDGAFTGAITLDAASAPPAMTANLSLVAAHPRGAVFDLPLDLSGGELNGEARIVASGYSAGALLATLSGDLQVRARGGTLLGVDLARVGARLEDSDLRAALSGGSTPFQTFELAAELKNGAATITSSGLAAPSGTAALTGLLDIAGLTSEIRLALHPAVADPPELALRMSGALATPVRTPEIADALRWRAEHAQAAATP